MREYRLYRLDTSGHVRSRHEFDAVDDAAAVQHARDAHGECDCEIWERARKVAVVPRDGPVRWDGKAAD
jgi:hypothetical protein